MAKKNMDLWSSVETTDPEFTTKVNQRGGFTAIGAQYQIRTATETFGPFGIGWGVSDENFTIMEDVGLALYQATLWYKYDGSDGTLPINSSIRYHHNNRVDDDFSKKVSTDALTKGLSKIGFNADVFMGKFDDNKYVNSLEKNKNGVWKKEINGALKGLNEKDEASIRGYMEDGTLNSKNYKKALNRIQDLKDSYVIKT